MNPVDIERHHELSAFLRSRRARVSPEQVGLPRGTRRRTPGLRRGEVAMLAGISLEWYTWLEQGRDINVSVQLLESLARVLQLGANEREHLFLLALRQRPPVEQYAIPTVSPTLRQFIEQLPTTPACIVDVRLNILEQNVAHKAVFGTSETPSERDRNLIWRMFTIPGVPRRNKEWEELARVYIAQFRAGYGRFINDPWWAEIIADLSEISYAFREVWAHHEICNVTEGRKTFHHAVAGELTFDFLWLQTVDSSDLRILLHTARNEETMEKIQQLVKKEYENITLPALT